MIFIGNNQSTKNIDNFSINELGIPSIILMENAAINFIKNLKNIPENILIVCGKGNNGGDGYAIARHLMLMKKNVTIFACDTEKMSTDCQINYNVCKQLHVPVETDIKSLEKLLLNAELVIDAIFGTGLSSHFTEYYSNIINQINSSSKYTVSVDIPSGISGNDGTPMETCIKASRTISFVTYKQGFLNYKSLGFFGKITVVNIGIPDNFIKNFVTSQLLEKNFIKSLYIPRSLTAHKGNFGHSIIIAGSEGYTGAAVIAADTAVKSGSGLVTLATDSKTRDIVSTKLLEAMTCSFDDFDDTEHFTELLKKSTAVAFGPGIKVDQKYYELLKFVIENTSSPIIIDAGGISLLAENPELLSKLKNRCIITPHLGEFSKISGLSVSEINSDRMNTARDFADKYSITVLLKGYNTIITNGCEIFVNSTGNSHMATGGMGDALTGLITSLVSQGYTLINAANIGAFFHGYIGDRLLKKQEIITAEDIILNIKKYSRKLFR